MKKQILLWIVPVLVSGIVVLFSVEGSRLFIVDLVLRIFLFVKENILAIVAAFFLVKGKFVLTLFLKKIALLSATGLGKRYFIEKVINHNVKIHFLDHITEDIKRLILYVKKNFKNFPLVKQIIAGLAFVSSLGFVGKFMGGMLAMKVFIAKFWSFLLVIFLKAGTGIVYFFTDYLWGSWIEPIVEVGIFILDVCFFFIYFYLYQGMQTSVEFLSILSHLTYMQTPVMPFICLFILFECHTQHSFEFTYLQTFPGGIRVWCDTYKLCHFLHVIILSLIQVF